MASRMDPYPQRRTPEYREHENLKKLQELLLAAQEVAVRLEGSFDFNFQGKQTSLRYHSVTPITPTEKQ